MAGPISHIFYAEHALMNFIDIEDVGEFILGNLFPDIRHLDKLPREFSHYKNVKLEDVKAEDNPFIAGMLFHSLIDNSLESYVRKRGVYAELPKIYLSSVALKTHEDLVLYKKVKHWSKYINSLKDVAKKEIDFGVSLDTVEKWHEMHRKFFKNPNLELRDFFYSYGFSKEEVANIHQLVEEIKRKRLVDMYLRDFYENLERNLTSLD